ncbi:M20/M25/M40 family metallo-hydrolase [Microbacterium oleivorans]|uniref:M20/M25/M40 family metallo-hydrolase n=1 Tax=Microbacterium oleivorans TaxID=273677 RepID=A0A7D5EUF4_9MICO|nr:M20/M25/M40 family metallo-hydrolase [Microbacterium oleivorans]QLD10711.1 M20/M25/M40 family metallo-hydrolase [Microbacterium oleivorans]
MDTAAVERFRELLRIPTVSRSDPAQVDGEAFDLFRATLERSYPRVHAALERELVAEHAMLFRWPGAASGDPLVLMAHYDVVPVVPDEWMHPPFGAVLTGEGDEATIHARGAIDDKGALVAIVEAVESLLAEGYVPARDVYLAFGHDEEVAGTGAPAIVQVLRARGVRPALVLDEGGAVVEQAVPGVDAETAMIGVAERGIATLRLTAREAGGHASTPPGRPATARLARAIDRLQHRPFPVRLSPPVRAMFRTLAPHAREPFRTLFRHIRLTGMLLARVLPRFGPETNALVRTTAVVTELHGADGENVLATTARASVNVRLLIGDTVGGVADRVRAVIGDPGIEVEVHNASDPSPVSPWRGEPWRRVARAVASALGEEVVPTPYLQLGASDSRWFTAISGHVYRFAPFRLTASEREALHAHDERIRVDVWLRGIAFYRDLLRLS